MPIPAFKYDLNLGLVNAKAKSDLGSGQLTVAQGILYKRGSEEAHFKIGRTAFASTQLGTPAGGLYYCEFSSATPQLVARAGTNFWRADMGLTGTWVSQSSTENATPTGLWGTYANDRYYFNDGAGAPSVFQSVIRLDLDPAATTPSFMYRTGGLNPPTETPLVTVNTGTVATITLTSATVTSSGAKLFSNPGLFTDGDKTTFANVTMGTDGNIARIFAVNFTGTGAGSRADWVLDVTHETSVTNNGNATTVVSYTTNGGSSYTEYDRSSGALAKRTLTIPIDGTFDCAMLGVRIAGTKIGFQGNATFKAYDVRCYNGTGQGGVENTVVTGLIYWWTEKVDYLGIESVAGSPSASTGVFSLASSVRVKAPSAPVNTLTTSYVLYRTSDGGSYPTGTQVGIYKIGMPYAFDKGPLSTVASTLTYAAFTVAGVIYHRDVIPPIGTVTTTYQNAIVTAPTAFPNKLRYSASGFPESFPTLNVINLASDQDDTVMGLAPLSSQLGVFMQGRCRRIDHLPQPSDPTFGVSPEDFAPDHGLESRNGLAYITPPSGVHSHIAYVARDGIRVTDLYSTRIVTNNIDWKNTVDTTAFVTTILRNNSSSNRLEFYFTPTSSFRTDNGWDAATNGCMWLHYQVTDNYDPSAMRVTIQAAAISSAYPFPFQGTDYMALMSNGARSLQGIVYIDEVGTTDAMNSVDVSGTVYRRIQTGQLYIDSTSRLVRSKLDRLVLDSDGGVPTFAVTATGGRDDLGQTWSTTRTYNNTVGGAKPLWFNISGQWHQITINADSASVAPARLRNVSWTMAEIGEFV